MKTNKVFLVAKALLLAVIAAGGVAEIIPEDGFDPFIRGFLSGCAFAGIIGYLNSEYAKRA
jgi:hypothetical protein